MREQRAGTLNSAFGQRARGRPPRRLHHFVDYPAEEERIGLCERLRRVTMELLVRGNRAMIAAPVSCDVDRVAKGAHHALRRFRRTT